MRRFFTALLIAGALAAACGPAGLPSAGEKLRVVATYSVLGDLVRNVGGDRIDVIVLVGPGQDTHTFEPIAANGVALTQAALLFENGLGFETWLDDLYQSSNSRAQRVVVTAAIEPRHAPKGEGDTSGHAAEELDPHAWHNVAKAMKMVQAIADALAAADPASAEAYRSNASAYTAELEALDKWVFDRVRSLPDSRRKLVTNHDSLGYFADRYGFVIIGSVLPASTEGASPSAQDLAALVEAVRAQDVPAVFAENVASKGLINQVASEAGVTLVGSLYTDALGPSGSEADTYVKMMRYNVTTIVAALSQ